MSIENKWDFTGTYWKSLSLSSLNYTAERDCLLFLRVTTTSTGYGGNIALYDVNNSNPILIAQPSTAEVYETVLFPLKKGMRIKATTGYQSGYAYLYY